MRFVVAFLRPIALWLCRLLFKIRFVGTENIPPGGACLIAPNHVTYADPVWITIPILRPVHYMAWDRIFRIPVLGFLMRAFGAFPVRLEGGDVSAQKEASELLRRGKALVIFPEGGRSKTGELMPFKLGLFRLAIASGTPILPVTIDGAYEIWPVGRILPRPGRLTVTYHPVVQVEAAPGLSREELKARARLLARQVRESVASALPASALGAGEGDAQEPNGNNRAVQVEETRA